MRDGFEDHTNSTQSSTKSFIIEEVQNIGRTRRPTIIHI